MRPTDENQHGSTRPNLVSGSRRPAGGEDNILARLDRDGARATAGGTIAGGRRALVALGGMVIFGLICTLGCLAHENATTKRVLPGAAVDTAVAPVAAAKPGATAGAKPGAAAAIRVDLDPGEKIVEAPRATIVPQPEATPVPPLALLQPARETAARPAPPASPRPVGRATLGVARRAAAPVASTAKPEPQAVDSDVALLSAIIMHASSHAAEREQLESQACPAGRRCAAKE